MIRIPEKTKLIIMTKVYNYSFFFNVYRYLSHTTSIVLPDLELDALIFSVGQLLIKKIKKLNATIIICTKYE